MIKEKIEYEIFNRSECTIQSSQYSVNLILNQADSYIQNTLLHVYLMPICIFILLRGASHQNAQYQQGISLQALYLLINQPDCCIVSILLFKQNIFVFISMYQSASRAPTLHQWDIPDSRSLPLPDDKRKITDVVCIIIGVLFGLALFIAALIMYNSANLHLADYPSDSKGNVCAINAFDAKGKYPFLYFNDLSDPLSERYCVDDCPVQGVPPQCFGSCDLMYYSNYPSNSNLGALCLPTDQNLKNQLLIKAGLDTKFNAISSIGYLLKGIAITFGIALIWLLVVQFLPHVAIFLAFFISAVLLIIAAIIAFTGANTHFSDFKGWAIFFGVVFVLLLILLIYYVCAHKKQLKLCGCFLDVAGDCFKKNLTILLFVLLFLALTVGFIVLIIFQYLAFSSYGTPVLSGVYYENKRNWFLTFLLVIQAIWGLSFFRDAFNYVVSGIACQWYFMKQNISGMFCWPLKRLFTKNFGSVVGGSLFTGFFYIPALIVSFLASRIDCCLCNLFDLTRTDTYAYIYLSGNSYCPSSRQAQYLCFRSKICRQNQSILAVYAFFTRVAIAFASILIVYWITKDNLVQEKVPFSVLAGIFFVCLYVSCYLVDIHSIISEALMLCFLTQYDLEEGWSYKEMNSCPEKLSKLIIDIEKQQPREFGK